ncbi:MAG: 1,2-phenylacetyl-CoA epoxidase subunit PaaD [Bacteroidia bacterium]|jgi:ring-1,2-phenylacetyl-CoA epoxidase subunit PaaD
MPITSDSVYTLLEEVMDPEIPTISIVDMGIVTGVDVVSDTQVHVTLTPTFSGCPALKVMEELVIQRLHEAGIPEASVTTSFAVQWNTNMISEKGLQALLKHGLAPPPKHDGYIELDVLSDTPCPLCGSRNTTLKSPFGPTLCRSLHYCNNCKNAFEGFKPVS